MMIPIHRLPEPQILIDNKAKWTEKYLEARATQPKKRPENKQYAHSQIKNTLQSMGHGKCFYCEAQPEENEGEVDHYIETSECPDKAFEWENLYWSCRDCNSKKQSNEAIPVQDCLDPCDISANHKNHLSFNDCIIRAVHGSPKGDTTIRKYKLNRMELKFMRSMALHQFRDKYDEFQKNMRLENRAMRDEEKEILRSFADASRPFSLMFQIYLQKLEI